VRGVEGLRVVDVSAWPKISETFVALLTYMMSEKAADVVVADAKSKKVSLRSPKRYISIPQYHCAVN
jgi:choline dehydrogenase-like flavoprotein